MWPGRPPVPPPEKPDQLAAANLWSGVPDVLSLLRNQPQAAANPPSVVAAPPAVPNRNDPSSTSSSSTYSSSSVSSSSSSTTSTEERRRRRRRRKKKKRKRREARSLRRRVSAEEESHPVAAAAVAAPQPQRSEGSRKRSRKDDDDDSLDDDSDTDTTSSEEESRRRRKRRRREREERRRRKRKRKRRSSKSRKLPVPEVVIGAAAAADNDRKPAAVEMAPRNDSAAPLHPAAPLEAHFPVGLASIEAALAATAAREVALAAAVATMNDAKSKPSARVTDLALPQTRDAQPPPAIAHRLLIPAASSRRKARETDDASKRKSMRKAPDAPAETCTDQRLRIPIGGKGRTDKNKPTGQQYTTVSKKRDPWWNKKPTPESQELAKEWDSMDAKAKDKTPHESAPAAVPESPVAGLVCGVTTAVGLALRNGPWPSPLRPLGTESLSYSQHFLHFWLVAESLSQFALKIILPQFEGAVDENNLDRKRIVLGTLLLLWELLMQNVESVFGDSLLELAQQEEETKEDAAAVAEFFKRNLVSAVILAALDNFAQQTQDAPSQKEFMRSVEAYRKGSHEFAQHFGPLGPSDIPFVEGRPPMTEVEKASWSLTHNMEVHRHSVYKAKERRRSQEGVKHDTYVVDANAAHTTIVS